MYTCIARRENKNNYKIFFVSDCGTVPDVYYGNVELEVRTDSTLGATAVVSCNYGYTAENEKITCQANGKWEAPRCIKVCKYSLKYLCICPF
jgi:hypothetical protein